MTPTSLAGGMVRLAAQIKTDGRWVKAKTTSATISPTGAYAWKYTPAKKGAYRMRATIARTAMNTAAGSPWLAFKVRQPTQRP